MAYDLEGGDNDFEMTNSKSFFSKEDFCQIISRYLRDSLDPVIPKGTRFLPPAIVPKMPATADSLYFNDKSIVTDEELKLRQQ